MAPPRPNDSSGYKRDYVQVVYISLNLEGHKICIIGSKGLAILLDGGNLPNGGVASGKGLRLQPV